MKIKTKAEKQEQVIRILLHLSNRMHAAVKEQHDIDLASRLGRRISKLKQYSFLRGLEHNYCALAQYRTGHPLRK